MRFRTLQKKQWVADNLCIVSVLLHRVNSE